MGNNRVIVLQVNEIMDRVRRILAAEMWACVIVSLAVVLLYETDLLLPGLWHGDVNAQFIVKAMMEVVTICMIPLALRLFRFRPVSKSICNDAVNGLLTWGSLRMMMICLPMTANTLFYYLFGLDVTFGYMGIICLICILFIYPSRSRCISETGKEK